MVSVFSSTLFHWFWVCLSDNYHITSKEFREFYFNNDICNDKIIKQLRDICHKLIEDYHKNSRIRIEKDNRNNLIREVQIFEPRQSKPIIDEIDCVFANHYGFTDEELDFIINYDIKYRMGRESEEAND